MSYYTTPMSKLEAINIILSSIGEPEIVILDGAGIDAQRASDLIDEVSRSTQIKGWHWNRETQTLSPDADGFINLPNNVAKVDTTKAFAMYDVVQRGQRLFNRTDNTYVFTLPLELDIYVILPFEDLPPSVKDYVTAQAAVTLQQRVLGAISLDSFLSEKLATTYAEMVRDEMQVADPNILKDNWSTRGIVSRGWFRRGAYL